MPHLIHAIIGITTAVLLSWAVLVIALLSFARDRVSLASAVRLLPDLLILITRLARDKTLPRGVRIRLWLLIAYLAVPIDLIPDFIPIIGYADDAIIVLLALRSTMIHAGPDAITRHWPGTVEGRDALMRLVPNTR